LNAQGAAKQRLSRQKTFQMQPIEVPHDREIGVRHRARLVIDAAPADPQNFSLPGDRQIVLTGRSSLCAQQSRLGERSF
jgi:hypothetical protein